ncbi:hypothetical protein SRABI83_00119 [Arthrobacter sp. Bi83]|uniref:hypothetical protein n=1 Tax=Arthrobacter sp. Bi83 TaxID=2822353 RepID=UPI001D4998C8|nr:hypothetical protein [Arthrobacter sp. Bi83]CAH0127200.1 hypothetical protein SRABI83_00119 [Arthrobacter sp. Bi83]
MIVLNSSSSTPAWVAPVLAGAFTLLGVLVANLFNWLGDKRKTKREDEQRWHDIMREEASQLIAVSEEALETMNSRRTSSAKETPDQRREMISKARTANGHYLALRAIAPEVVINAGGAVYANVLSATMGKMRPYAAMSNHRKAAVNLIEALRKEIGVMDEKPNKNKALHK